PTREMCIPRFQGDRFPRVHVCGFLASRGPHTAPRLALDVLHVQLAGVTAVLAFDERLPNRVDPLLMLFEQTQTGANNLTGGTVTAALDLPADESLEMIAKGNAGVLRHKTVSFGTNI